MEKSKQASSGYSEAITTRIGFKETESNKAWTRLIRKKSYELVYFLWSYDVHPSEFAIRSDTSKVRVDNKSIKHVYYKMGL